MKDIKKEMVLPCTAAEAWKMWTTADGLQSFFGAANKVEISLGGPFEIYFSLDEPEGLRGSEKCTVLSFVENKLLSFTWNAPPSIPEVRDTGLFTFVVLLFENLDHGACQLNLFHQGWNYPGDKWVETHAYFNDAWDFVLKSQKAALVQKIAKQRSSEL